MHEANKLLIEQFYTAFQNMDAEGMVKLYHKQIDFDDPVFGRLHGDDARNMWRMLIDRSKGQLQIDFEILDATDFDVSARWEARYVFSKTKRKVHNLIEAGFIIEDGKIVVHTDKFDFWRWSRMALGLPGYILGGTPLLKNKVRLNSLELLRKHSQSGTGIGTTLICPRNS